ncbi:MAG TPA: RNA pyrophosphohydrolase [Sphingobium sp.]|uniref:RNA pyrophosphohydrolase n=1 Tax=Sphingobium sp. TaxID=1912891 RepID=UPI002ED264AE
MTKFANLPYRPCVGIMMVNRGGQVFVGQRIDSKEGDAWQMPQGGIDPGEEAEQAAVRELGEETGVKPEHIQFLARTKEELLYDLPDELIGRLWGGKYRGQRQYWFLARFLGEDADIDIATEHPEFDKWRWAAADTLVDLIVPFKKKIYRAVVAEFHDLI